MKYMPLLFMCIIFSCKKENQTVISPPAGASNKIEGDIIWGGVNSTHFINQPWALSNIYAYFDLDSSYNSSGYQINMTGSAEDTTVTFSILNPNLNTPGVYNFQELDSNHWVSTNLSAGYSLSSFSVAYFFGISYSNAGRLTIDTISENHISGSIDAYCNRLNLTSNIPDTNEVHLLFHFSGDLRRD